MKKLSCLQRKTARQNLIDLLGLTPYSLVDNHSLLTDNDNGHFIVYIDGNSQEGKSYTVKKISLRQLISCKPTKLKRDYSLTSQIKNLRISNHIYGNIQSSSKLIMSISKSYCSSKQLKLNTENKSDKHNTCLQLN